MRVIAFTGMPGAGKSEAVEVGRALGVPVVRMGDLVWEETQRRGLGLEASSVGAVASELRRSDGMDAWARRTVDRVRRDHHDAPLVVVDGVRNWEEVEHLRQTIGQDFELVAVTSAPDTRVDRLTGRGRHDDEADEAGVRKRDERELGWGIARAIAMADTVLTNDGSLADFRQRVQRYFMDALERRP